MCSYQAGKLTAPAARREYIKCAFNLEKNLSNLECWEKERKKQIADEWMEHELAQPLDEPVFYPRKDIAVWNEWYEEQKLRKWRQKPIVLNGPTMLGKTAFVTQSLEGRTYLCSCAYKSSPDLKTFEGPPFQKNIFFDEASAQMVSDHRDLFQSLRHPIPLGHSATNCHAYHVNVMGVRMVLASNKWHETVAALEKESDRDWIQKNVVVMEVTESLLSKERIPDGRIVTRLR